MPETTDPVRRELAAAAARLIADGGLDYAGAKRKAARQLLGESSAAARSSMPDNDSIDAALLEHLNLFDEDHADRVDRRRRVAAALMAELADFRPYLTGAVWKGIVAEHAPIHLQLFHDNPKDVEIHLLNRQLRFDVETTPHFRSREEVEAILLWWRNEPVMLSLYGVDDLRGALRSGAAGAERGDLSALQARIEEAAGAGAAGDGGMQ
ncbi:MAG: UDP-N-acetylmuramate--alanine ligase [Limnobacter sp.]|nr:UDP-N-acetylmuramate--alanine ligase [Limnobacter sp.]